MPVIKSNSLDDAIAKLRTGGVQRIVLQSSDATGDISHVAPLLGTFASYGVLVSRATTNDKGAYIPNVYIDEFAIAQNRVAWVDADVNRRLVEGGITLDQCTQLVVGAIRADRGLKASVAPQGGMTDLKALGAGKSTGLSGIKAVLRGPRFDPSTVSSSASPSHAKDGVINDYLGRLGILPYWRDRHVVVIWGRISREIHVSANSSTLAIAQLARLCLDAKLGVILAGDINFEKLDAHDKKVVGQAICIGQFWKRHDAGPGADGKLRYIPHEQMVEPQLAARPDQVRLFYVLGKYLKSAGKRLVHVGMRSGGLDAYAFSGQRTLYLLPNHFGDERMEEAVEGLAETKGFAFAKQGLKAPVTGYQYAPTKKLVEGHTAFVHKKLLDANPNKLSGPAKMAVKDAQERMRGLDAVPKTNAKGFQPGEAAEVLKTIEAMLTRLDPVPLGASSASAKGDQ